MNQNFNPYTNPQDHENQDHPNPFTPPPFQFQPPKPVNLFERFALSFTIGSILSCTVFYLSYILAALGIVFALLSRGDQMQLSRKAKIALFLGIGAIIFTTGVTIWALYYAIDQFGSIEAMLQEYCNMYGLDFEELYGDFF